MKNLYVCEKCGKSYEDYDECYKCENSHVNVDMYQECEDMSPTWHPGSIMPETVILKSANIWNEDLQEYEQKYGVYKFVKLLNHAESEKIITARQERQEEAERQWREYREREEQRKAEEQRKLEQEANA